MAVLWELSTHVLLVVLAVTWAAILIENGRRRRP